MPSSKITTKLPLYFSLPPDPFTQASQREPRAAFRAARDDQLHSRARGIAQRRLFRESGLRAIFLSTRALELARVLSRRRAGSRYRIALACVRNR